MGWLIIFLLCTLSPLLLGFVVNLPKNEALRQVEEEDFSPKVLLPVAMLLSRFLPGKLRVFETNRLMHQVVLIYGTRTAALYMKVHLASKCLGFWMGANVAAFFCMVLQASFLAVPAVPLTAIALFFLADTQLNTRYKEKSRAMSLAFPAFVSQLALLVGAGLHVRQAIVRIVRGSGAVNPLYKELKQVLDDIDAGISEQQAYGELAERCRIREISNFSGILLQHVRLGGNQMLFELRRMAIESWEERKQTARKLGEEASSKLIFPLSLMFIAVVLISIAPAFLAIGLGF